jgi:hypothetical protein
LFMAAEVDSAGAVTPYGIIPLPRG